LPMTSNRIQAIASISHVLICCEVTLFDTATEPFTKEPRKYRPSMFDENETKHLVAAASFAGVLPHEFVKSSVSTAILAIRERFPEFDAYLSLL